MKTLILKSVFIIFLVSNISFGQSTKIISSSKIQKNKIMICGQHYQKYKDYKNLNKVVKLLILPADTSYVKIILGEPLDMGFEYRYLTDKSIKGCPTGAVFHKNDSGKINQKWIGKICE